MGSKDNPCYQCPDRYPACSDHCRKDAFLAWKAERERMRKELYRENGLKAYTAKQITKNRRKK